MIKRLILSTIVSGFAFVLLCGNGFAMDSIASEPNVLSENTGEVAIGIHSYYGTPVIGDPKFWDFHEVPDMGLETSSLESRTRAYYGPSVDAYYGVRNIGDPVFWDFHEVPDVATGAE